MGLRRRLQERRAEQAEVHRFRMRERLVSLGDDYWIEDEARQRVYRVDGKALRLRDTLDFEDLAGNRLCRIQARALRLRDSMAIERPDGLRLALVHKALVSPLRERWKVDVDDGPDLRVQGNILDHEYDIERDGDTVAEVSKKWFRLRDTYGVEVSPDVDPVLVLAVTVAVDAMAHPD